MFQSLPDEILYIIFEFIPIQYIPLLLLVNKPTKQLIESDYFAKILLKKHFGVNLVNSKNKIKYPSINKKGKNKKGKYKIATVKHRSTLFSNRTKPWEVLQGFLHSVNATSPENIGEFCKTLACDEDQTRMTATQISLPREVSRTLKNSKVLVGNISNCDELVKVLSYFPNQGQRLYFLREVIGRRKIVELSDDFSFDEYKKKAGYCTLSFLSWRRKNGNREAIIANLGKIAEVLPYADEQEIFLRDIVGVKIIRPQFHTVGDLCNILQNLMENFRAPFLRDIIGSEQINKLGAKECAVIDSHRVSGVIKLLPLQERMSILQLISKDKMNYFLRAESCRIISLIPPEQQAKFIFESVNLAYLISWINHESLSFDDSYRYFINYFMHYFCKLSPSNRINYLIADIQTLKKTGHKYFWITESFTLYSSFSVSKFQPLYAFFYFRSITKNVSIPDSIAGEYTCTVEMLLKSLFAKDRLKLLKALGRDFLQDKISDLEQLRESLFLLPKEDRTEGLKQFGYCVIKTEEAANKICALLPLTAQDNIREEIREQIKQHSEQEQDIILHNKKCSLQ